MLSKSKSQTQRIAARLAKKVFQTSNTQHPIKAAVVALQGDLGAGKTAFTQGFCRALGVKHGVSSPTFVIMRRHKISRFYSLDSRFSQIYHFDLYRLRKVKEILDLGFKKIISNPENIVLIEWPERVKKLLPKNTIWVKFGHGEKENERIIDIK